jgi:hypothetical protein
VVFSATADMQKKPLARVIRRFEWRIPRDKDSVVEQSEFELPVPVSKLSDDSVVL